jgi:hypothetical protein
MGGTGCVGRSPKGECRRTRRGPLQEGVTQESGCGRRRFYLPPKKQARHRHKPPSSLRCRAQHAHDRVRVPAKYGTPRQPCRYRIGIDGDCRCRPQAASMCAPAAGRRSSFAAVATAGRFTAAATAQWPHVRPACAWPASAISTVATAVTDRRNRAGDDRPNEATQSSPETQFRMVSRMRFFA